MTNERKNWQDLVKYLGARVAEDQTPYISDETWREWVTAHE